MLSAKIETEGLILISIAAFVITMLIVPFIIKRFKERKIVGRDMNKLEKPEVAEMGGITVLLGFSFAMMLAIFLFSYLGFFQSLNLTALLAGFITIVLVGFLGIVDDLIGWKKGIRQWQHALIPLAAALPLMALNVGSDYIVLPFVGAMTVGILYSLVIVPLGITSAANATNMLAGMNGLEAGLGIINTLIILIIAAMRFQVEAAILMAAMLGALIAFMRFNWFPAKIFPGDSLTLMVGAGIASAVIIGDMERIGIALFAIYFIELGFKAKHFFQTECFGIPQKDGTLKADPRGGSLTHWIMRRGKFTEKQVVGIILMMQVIIAFTVYLLFKYKRF